MARRSALMGGACGAARPARSRSPRYRWSSAARRVAKNSRPPVRGGGGHREPGSRRPGIHDGTDLPRAGSAPTCTRAVHTARRGCLPGSLPAAARRVAVTARGQEMHAVAVAAAVRRAHHASGDIPWALIVAPGVGLELFAADAAGADHGLAPVPAVAGVVDQLGRLLDDRHLLDPAASLGRVAVVGDAGAGDVQVSGGGGVIKAGSGGAAVRPAAPIRFRASARARGPPAWRRPDRLPATKGRVMPVNRAIRVMMGMTATIKLDPSMASGLLPGPVRAAVGGSPAWADRR